MRWRDIPWPRVLAEGAVIVGSILLAFSLDAWWDNSNREDELRAQLEVVAREMGSTREALGRALSAHELNAHLAAHLTSVLETVEEGEAVAVSDTLVGPLLPQVTADVTTGSLEAFITAGGLETMSDMEVRRELLDWPTLIQDALDDEIYLRNFAAADLASHLRAHADIASAERNSVPWLRSRLGPGPELDPGLLGMVTLRRDRQLRNLLAARESGERAMQSSLERMRDQADRIITALEGVR